MLLWRIMFNVHYDVDPEASDAIYVSINVTRMYDVTPGQPTKSFPTKSPWVKFRDDEYIMLYNIIQGSGVHKGGFTKGVFSSLCVIIVFLLLNPPLLNPPLWTPDYY